MSETSPGLNWNATAPVTLSPGSSVPGWSAGLTDVCSPSPPPLQPSRAEVRDSHDRS